MVVQTQKFIIAGLVIEICNYTNTSIFLPSLDPFIVTSDHSDITLEIHVSKVIEKESGNADYDFRYSAGFVKCYTMHTKQIFDIFSDTKILLGKISKFSNTKYILHLNNPNNKLIINFTLMFVFCGVSCFNRLLIHSSVVVLREEAYLFYGKSGMGKSTQAIYWTNTFDNCWQLNDDNPIVEIYNGIPYVWGSPWSGKSPIFINKRFPIKGLVSIGKNKSFKVKRFGKRSFISDFFQSCCYNPIDKDSIFKIFDICYSLWLNLKPICFHCSNTIESAKYLYNSLNSSFLALDSINVLINWAQNRGCIIKLLIEGNSMYPTLKSGQSIVYIKPNEFYEIGDIILVKYYEKLIIHRLMNIGEDFLKTKGDSNNFSEIVPKSSYIGKVIKIEDHKL